MPLITIQRKPVLKPVTIKLEEKMIERLTAYCRFLDSSRDHVVAGILAFVMNKDREFAVYLANQNSNDGRQEKE